MSSVGGGVSYRDIRRSSRGPSKLKSGGDVSDYDIVEKIIRFRHHVP